VFTQAFLVQIRQKLQKIYSEVCVQNKENFEKCIPMFKTKGKKGNSYEKRGVWE
jgi:hypothetical protein